MNKIYKYPRTHHIEGSRLQPGDEDLNSVPYSAIAKRYVVIEEKVDGANAAISFNPSKEMLLQSRGHFLTGGFREKHFNLFKQWAYSHVTSFWEVLGKRYILYGEWLYAKHTIFYNALPHYFLEYDVFDTEKQHFLSTQSRSKLLNNLKIVSVPVLFAGTVKSYDKMIELVSQSHFIKSGYLEQLNNICQEKRLDIELTFQQTDQTGLMEGLYIKVEEEDKVLDRYKYVRASFLTTMIQSDSHWLNRPIIPNLLSPDVDLF